MRQRIHFCTASDGARIAYSTVGSGLSDWEVEDLSLEAFVRDLESVVDAAGLERFSLLGISQGCAVSILYSIRHPERVSRLVLYGAGWAHCSPQEHERRSAMTTLTLQGWGQDSPAYRQVFTSLYVPDATPEQAAWFNDLQRISTSPENVARLQRIFSHIRHGIR